MTVGGSACNDSSVFIDQRAVTPQIISVAGPPNGVIACKFGDPASVCPLPIDVKFRLAEGQFVTKAYVRFQGDGGDIGVDRAYLLTQTFGKGLASVEGGNPDVDVTFNATVPPNILRQGIDQTKVSPALYTYSVRLVTGVGAESASSQLTVSVQ